MRITPLCRALALHEIFDNHAVDAGGKLPLAELELAWRTTGLRQSDLNETLLETQASGEFALHDLADGVQVELTELGYRHGQRDLKNLHEIDELILAYAMLATLKRRRPNGFLRGRRNMERPAVRRA